MKFDGASFVGWILLGCCSLLNLGCDTESPQLCLFASTDFTGDNQPKTPNSFDCTQLTDTSDAKDGSERCTAAIATDNVVYVRHTLPEDVVASGPLKLRVETPCGANTYEVPYADGVALWASEPPVGAACFLVVTALLDNSELRCEVQAKETSKCTNVCPAP